MLFKSKRECDSIKTKKQEKSEEWAGVLVLPTGPKTIRLLPPLVISKGEIEEVVEKIGEILK